MSVLMIGPYEREVITKLLALARDQTMPWSIGKNIAIDDRAKPTSELTLKERKHDNPFPRSQHVMLGSYRCAISFEEQPAGLCRHLSVSVKKRGKLPSPEAMKMLAEEFGFTSGWPPSRGRVWLEEFEPNHHAVNILELEPS
jgi:hypothetical protein